MIKIFQTRLVGWVSVTRRLAGLCRCPVALGLMGYALLVNPARAGQPTEYEVKAAFLFNFAKFVDWPPQAFGNDQLPLVIGIVGEDPFGGILPALVQNEKLKNRSIEIRHFKADEDMSACHLLFISRSETGRTADILERIKSRPVLTVSEQEDFLKQGGLIDFVIVKETVRFDINVKALEKAGLKASSKLLGVARAVKN